jgi:OmpA family protein
LRETGTSGAIGGATGAVIGAIVGSPGTGAAIGAAGSATSALLHGAFSSRDLDPIERGYVDRCLREQGYDPMGWR